MNHLVTIVTVTYNAEDLLEETILSVINQSYENIEYIVIDGGSTDGTVDIIKKYEDKIDYWVSEPDDGIYYAMNKAIEKATGKWINFMNAGDTFFDLDTVIYVMEHKDTEAELIYGNYQFKETGLIQKATDISKCHMYMPFSHQSLFTKTILMKKEPYNTCYHLASDHDFIVKMYHNKRIFSYLERTISVFTAGGFAQSNTLLMYVESIKLLLTHDVPQVEIEQSWWYLELQKELSQYEIQKIAQLITQNEHLNRLYEANTQLTKYSLLKNPFKKYNAYKNMLALHKRIKDDLNNINK